MKGHVTSVKIEGDSIVRSSGTPVAGGKQSRNYMKFTGGIIRFGKLTMRDADLTLIDSSPQDPFDFSLDRYKDQLVAGYSKTTPGFGLEVFMVWTSANSARRRQARRWNARAPAAVRLQKR